MTTKRKDKSTTNADDRPINPPSLFKIEYPNSRTGMYSLRAPFKDIPIDQTQQQMYMRNSTPNVIHPEYLHMNQNQEEEPYDHRSNQRDADVQYSVRELDSRQGITLRRRPAFLTNSYTYGYLSPRYRVQLKLQPVQPNIYAVWDVDTPPPRSIPINEPIRRRERTIHTRSPRLVTVKSLSDDDSDYDDYLLCPHYPPVPYIPAPVRMVHVRQDANTICY